jgi:hypothetical protein
MCSLSHEKDEKPPPKQVIKSGYCTEATSKMRRITQRKKMR